MYVFETVFLTLINCDPCYVSAKKEHRSLTLRQLKLALQNIFKKTGKVQGFRYYRVT